MRALERARAEFEALKNLAARPGLPVVYDTNMLDHWQQPDQILWRKVFKDQGEDVRLTRLVVPPRVIDELDQQKYSTRRHDGGQSGHVPPGDLLVIRRGDLGEHRLVTPRINYKRPKVDNRLGTG